MRKEYGKGGKAGGKGKIWERGQGRMRGRERKGRTQL